MSRPRFAAWGFVLLALTACDAEERAAEGHLEQLCSPDPVRAEYLDFYFDDLRTHEPELWSEALETCTRACPAALGCAPVRSVAAWYDELGGGAPTASEPSRSLP